MNRKWSEAKWSATKQLDRDKVTQDIFIAVKVESEPGAHPLSQPVSAMPPQVFLDQIIKSLRAGEFLEELCHRLEQAREVGSATVDCQELLDFIRGGIK